MTVSGEDVRGPVPFVDLSRIHRPIEAELMAAIEGVIRRSDFILGEAVEGFEAAFAEYVGTRYAVGVNSGTSALAIALRAAGVGPGAEVIVPAHTYIATALAVVHAGARPIFCDVDEATGLIDLRSAAEVVSERTAAVMPVHLYGQACDMPALQTFASARGIALIEDAAQAHGARWDGRRIGSFGVAAGFSFYPSKNLGAFGDGGMIATSDSHIAEAARRYRNLGQPRKGEHQSDGANDRLDTIQAAVLAAKLPRLDGWNAQRVAAAASYRERLPAGPRYLPVRKDAENVYHLFPIRVHDRDRARTTLTEAGIETGVHYAPAVHRQRPFVDETPRTDLDESDRWAAEELSLPMFSGLDDREVEAVCVRLADALTEPELDAANGRTLA